MKPKFMLAVGRGSACPTDAQRRDALAEWLTSKDNPFFAKSTANRVWSYFFGQAASSIRWTTSARPIRRAIRRCSMR